MTHVSFMDIHVYLNNTTNISDVRVTVINFVLWIIFFRAISNISNPQTDFHEMWNEGILYKGIILCMYNYGFILKIVVTIYFKMVVAKV